MRTLATEVQLRRLLRTHAEYIARLRADADPDLPAAARSRLHALIEGVRQAWERDLAAATETPEQASLRRHVARSLTTLEAAAAELARPGSDLDFAVQAFRETALPLLFFLRGLEDVPVRDVRQVLEPVPLDRTA